MTLELLYQSYFLSYSYFSIFRILLFACILKSLRDHGVAHDYPVPLARSFARDIFKDPFSLESKGLATRGRGGFENKVGHPRDFQLAHFFTFFSNWYMLCAKTKPLLYSTLGS